MRWRSTQKKQVGDSVVHLVESQGNIGILVQRQTPHGVWQGVAVYPAAVLSDTRMQQALAQQRFHEVETEIDIEDVIREWGDPEGVELSEFIETEAGSHESREGLQGADDLTYLVSAERLTRKAKKNASPKAKTQPKVSHPYTPRSYPKPEDVRPDVIKLLPLPRYDNIIVSFSGGKDSVACALLLLEMGVDPSRIELWHQAVDGKPGRDERFWDWPCTESYCEAFAKAFGMKLLFQWKDGGYLGELTRRNVPTASTTFQLLNGREKTTGGESRPGTRLAFPAMSADLMTRWCSAYLKIDVAKKVFTNDPRFGGARTLVLTGERRQESGNRARYENVVDYASTQTRTVHQWRAVLGWFEQDVWEILAKYRVRPHPAYYVGWSRVSCLPCIFGNPDQWASVRDVAPDMFARMAKLEDKFYAASQQLPQHPWSAENQRSRYDALEQKKRSADRHHVSVPFKPKSFDGYMRTGESLIETADRGTSYITSAMRKHVKLAMSEHYDVDILLDPGEKWETPVGAYKHSGGPT